MKTLKNKSIKHDKSQSNIMTAMNNLKALSESQKKKKECLSSEVFEVLSSDSESEHFLLTKTSVKRKLSFGLLNKEHSHSKSNKRNHRGKYILENLFF